MKKLKDKILNEAYVIDERIIKVDHFINHMLDSKLLFDIGVEFSKKIKGATKIVTIEASGIAFAVATSFALDNIPIVFARKTSSAITSNTVYTSNIAPGDFYQEYSYAATGYNGKFGVNAAIQYDENIYLGLNLNSHFINFEKSTFLYESNDNIGSAVIKLDSKTIYLRLVLDSPFNSVLILVGSL